MAFSENSRDFKITIPMRQKSANRSNKAAISKRQDSVSLNTKRKSIQRPSTGNRPVSGQKASSGQNNLSRMPQSLNRLSKTASNRINSDSLMITIQNDEYTPVNQPSNLLSYEIQSPSMQISEQSNIQEFQTYQAPSYPSSVGVRYVMPTTVLNSDV